MTATTPRRTSRPRLPHPGVNVRAIGLAGLAPLIAVCRDEPVEGSMGRLYRELPVSALVAGSSHEGSRSGVSPRVTNDRTVRSRSVSHHRRREPRAFDVQLSRSRTPRRDARVPPVLGGGASQHARYRERGDRSGDRPHRGRDVHDPSGRRGHHAAEPRAANHRGAVRYPRCAVPRTHRPRPRPRARHRPAHRVRASPKPPRRPRCLPRAT